LAFKKEVKGGSEEGLWQGKKGSEVHRKRNITMDSA